MKKLFKDPTSNIFIQVLRYVLAGGLAYLVDYGLLIILTECFRRYYLTSAAVAFIAGSAASYILNVTWVFNKRTFKNRLIEISIFVLIGIVGLILNQYCLWFFTENMNIHYLYSKVISTIFVFILNFFARKYILFR
ncbi:MAG: GtrA family protein [Candidatus Omnitrophica bacterium]|nr:GtrA family protein [Candidatus Omnitrophota bacterium]